MVTKMGFNERARNGFFIAAIVVPSLFAFFLLGNIVSSFLDQNNVLIHILLANISTIVIGSIWSYLNYEKAKNEKSQNLKKILSDQLVNYIDEIEGYHMDIAKSFNSEKNYAGEADQLHLKMERIMVFVRIKKELMGLTPVGLNPFLELYSLIARLGPTQLFDSGNIEFYCHCSDMRSESWSIIK